MQRTLYIETSVVSYMTATPSDNLLISAHQLATHQFWTLLSNCTICASDVVIEEASRGDPTQAEKRLSIIRDFEVLKVDEAGERLAAKLIASRAIPEKYPEDALHIAVAAVNNIEFIITWNFKHINNPFLIGLISKTVTEAGYLMPVICSPEEFSGGHHE